MGSTYLPNMVMYLCDPFLGHIPSAANSSADAFSTSFTALSLESSRY